MATLNTAEHFGVSGDVGGIGPGRFADFLIVSDLESLKIDSVVAAGEVVAEDEALCASTSPFHYPESARKSVSVPRRMTASDFRIATATSKGSARCRVIETVENQVLTRCVVEDIPVVDGMLQPSEDSGISYLAVVERHLSSGRIGVGLVKGYGITRPYGLASTVAHDSHNLLVMGSDREQMAVAAGRVVGMNGGMCLAGAEGVLAEIALPIAGLMSEDPIGIVAEQAESLHQELRSLGCCVDDALMSFLFLALPVIPDLRLTDYGLVDVNAFKIVPVFLAADNPEN